jgi:hypothetical protein
MQVAPKFQDTFPRLGRYPEHGGVLLPRPYPLLPARGVVIRSLRLQHDAERAIQAGEQHRGAS